MTIWFKRDECEQMIEAQLDRHPEYRAYLTFLRTQLEGFQDRHVLMTEMRGKPVEIGEKRFIAIDHFIPDGLPGLSSCEKISLLVEIAQWQELCLHGIRFHPTPSL